LSVTAVFAPEAGLLTVQGDNQDNVIVISRDISGAILVNGGAVSIDHGTPTVDNTSLIRVLGKSGDDTLSLDEANGILPAADLQGGAGDDVLIGGSGDDNLDGGAGGGFMDGHRGPDVA